MWFVGLQGSRSRGEATDTSDIDIVVILDELTADDISRQKDLLQAVQGDEQAIVALFLNMKNGSTVAFEEASAILLDWCSKWIEITGL